MTVSSSTYPDAGSSGRIACVLAGYGGWLARHQKGLRVLQWGVVGLYLVLVAVPAFLPMPERTAHIWTNLTVFAQFAFWGLWWPFVILSMVIVGRSWCGLFCPEGTLTEVASRWSLGRAVPHWMRWRGWPFAAFACTTVYGQLVSVYQYPGPVLVVLGGSTLAAFAVGLLYGREKRVWCRYLCPVNGVFAALAKLAPVSFRVDRAAWAASDRPPRSEAVICAPLVPIRAMRGAGTCHMCGRCSGYRGAVALAPRSVNHEIVHVAGHEADLWQTILILFGMIGLATAAFHWTASGGFVAARQWAADEIVGAGIVWPLGTALPWWLLTDYPALNDVMTVLDGATLLAYLALGAVGLGGVLAGLLAAAARVLGPWSPRRFHHLVQTLIPVAGCGLFLGLSGTTVSMLRGEGLDLAFVPALRVALLAGAAGWSVVLAWQVTGRSAGDPRRAAATALVALAVAVASLGWVPGLRLW